LSIRAETPQARKVRSTGSRCSNASPDRGIDDEQPDEK
jgi:hypothetical protein